MLGRKLLDPITYVLWWNIKRLHYNKEAVLSNFDLTYLPCCLQPPPSPIFPGDIGGSLECRAHLSPHLLLKLCHFLVALLNILFFNYVPSLRQHMQQGRKHVYTAIPLQPWTGPEGSRRLRLPDFKTIGT